MIDGDTVALAGGERVRLIGIDAPEVGRDGAASQAGAEDATAALVNLVQEEGGGFVGLVHGRERRDTHGRLLAHLFLRDGTNVQARLLAEGFAVPLIIPPNL
ncbi:MAG: thermonuclease family protein, partial [Gammaproteobacteria bacterium]|nr:thermonuclease family protein [Gammaproteobacteria bacterium]